MPCSDAHNECKKSNTSANYSEETKHNHKNDHNDFCSPFCTCSCCNTVVALNFSTFYLKKSKLVVPNSEKIAIKEFSFISNFYGNIWQPPKINC